MARSLSNSGSFFEFIETDGATDLLIFTFDPIIFNKVKFHLKFLKSSLQFEPLSLSPGLGIQNCLWVISRLEAAHASRFAKRNHYSSKAKEANND